MHLEEVGETGGAKHRVELRGKPGIRLGSGGRGARIAGRRLHAARRAEHHVGSERQGADRHHADLDQRVFLAMAELVFDGAARPDIGRSAGKRLGGKVGDETAADPIDLHAAHIGRPVVFGERADSAGGKGVGSAHPHAAARVGGIFAIAKAVDATGIIRPGMARQQARQGDRHEAHVGAAGEAAPAHVLEAAQRRGDVPHAFKVGEFVDFEGPRIERQHDRHEGGRGDSGELHHGTHIVGRRPRCRAMSDGAVDDHQPIRLAAGHAELVLVDPPEGHALVELEGSLEVAAKLDPGDRQQSHLDAAAGLDAGDQPGKAPPASLEVEKSRGVQHGVELLAHGRIDLGDVAVKRRPQRACDEETREGPRQTTPAARSRVEAAMQERRQFGGRAGVPFTEEPAGQDQLPQ